MNTWVGIGSVLGFLGVAMGAFGAHALKLEGRFAEIYQTGAHYHLIHAVALVALGAWAAGRSEISVTATGIAFTAGILIFSGSLYALSITEARWLGAITPIGGVLFLVGWAALAWQALRG